jgi:hypothetical protein
MPDNMKEVSTTNKIKDIKDILSVFKKYGVKVYLSYGVLLGAVRDKDFIPWDDDADFDVIDKVDYQTRKAIGWTLIDLGFRPQPISFNIFGRMEPSEVGYNGDGETGIIVCERNFAFSIFFYKQEGNNYECYPKLGAPRLIGIPAKFYDSPTILKFKGLTFNTPAPHKEYLAYVYGHDWKTPIKELHAPNCITGKQKHD